MLWFEYGSCSKGFLVMEINYYVVMDFVFFYFSKDGVDVC